MSPSEFDLRAALHDGEGEQLDVDRLVVHARAHAAQRRVRVLSAAAVVAVITGVGVGIAVSDGNGHGSPSDSAAGAGAAVTSPAVAAGRTPKPAAPEQSRSSGYGTMNGSAMDAALVRCPERFPGATAAVKGTGSPAAGTPLFRTQVSSVVVCAYGTQARWGSASPPRPHRADLHGGAARRLAASLASASATAPAPRSCPGAAGPYAFAFIGLDGNGVRAGTAVVEMSSCGSTVTSGGTVRYGWSPPADLRRQLVGLSPE
jgi:hypothetical protein